MKLHKAYHIRIEKGEWELWERLNESSSRLVTRSTSPRVLCWLLKSPIAARRQAEVKTMSVMTGEAT